MAQDISLTETEIDLLREACAAKGGAVRVEVSGDIQRRLARMACAARLAKLGYFEEAEDHAWRIKPALKTQVAALLREHE
jgi:hypothetical protein